MVLLNSKNMWFYQIIPFQVKLDLSMKYNGIPESPPASEGNINSVLKLDISVLIPHYWEN